MTLDQMKDLLFAADDHLAAVLNDLDVGAYDCEDCGHKRYENFDHHQAAEALKGPAPGLRRPAVKLKPVPRAPTKDTIHEEEPVACRPVHPHQ